MRSVLRVGIVILGLSLWAAADRVPIAPTTTLSAETGNNTSAALTFAGQTNNNLAAGSVSKMPVGSLLYPGATTKVYAHFMPWFGGANHVWVGYESSDPAQVHRQVDDMLSRGIRGAIVDWYGPNFARENNTTIALRSEAETRGGNFEFAVMEDVGALNSCGNTAGCDVTARLIADLTYAYNTYEISPAYMKQNGRPVVFFFGVEQWPIDWVRTRAAVPGNPLFIMRNAGAFTNTNADGGFGWVGLSSNSLDMGFGYIDYFYQMGVSAPTKAMFGTGYKGFNDSVAAWAPNPPRVLAQQCGQAWLQTIAESGKYYSATNQLPAIQLVTWNDYEEGTEIESGIDNCVSLAAAAPANGTLSWTVTGAESTIDHYTVFITADGQNLMSLGDVPAGTHTFNLSAWNTSLVGGTYSLMVKATGKATLRNQMSAAVSYFVPPDQYPPPPPPAPPVTADFTIAASPAMASVQGGQTGQYGLNVTPNSALSGTVTLTCQNLPQYASCNFSQATLNAAGNPVNASLNIATSQNIAQAAAPSPVWMAGMPALGLLAFALVGDAKRRRKMLMASMVLTLMAMIALTGCGGGGMKSVASNPSPAPTPTTVGVTPPGTYTVKVLASGGGTQHTVNLTLVVQ